MKLIPIAGLLLGLSAPSLAHEYKAGALLVDHPIIRVASPESKTGAGFMTITNKGKAADRLLSVSTAASGRSDLHGTLNEGGVMKMRAQAGGVPIPAGGKVSFAPGGQPGQMIKARLMFEKARPVDVAFKAETAASAQHDHH
jgi:copper(I)-binding protein